MPSAWARRVLSATVGAWLTLPPASASAYVRAVSESGTPLWWKNTCITMELYLGAPPPLLTADAYLRAAVLAGKAWSHDELACTGLSISMAREPAATADTGLDGINKIVFRQDSWCEHPAPTDLTQPYCYPANALAVTTVFKSKSTGEIVDTDMELNAVSFTWADLVARPDLVNGSTVDFQNTLTHELGHVIGLAHPCYSSNDGPSRLLDNNGVPELDCTDPNLPAAVLNTTMFPSVATSDTARRVLSPDDQQAAYDIYPAATAVCPSTESSHGCSMLPSRPKPEGSTWLAIVPLCLAATLLGFAFRRTLRPARSRTNKLQPRADCRK